MNETVYNRDAERMEYRHVSNLRRLADRVDSDGGYFATIDDDLGDAELDAIAALLRAKADKIEAHMEAIDTIMSDEFSTLVHDVEWVSTGDYGTDKLAETWEEYGSR